MFEYIHISDPEFLSTCKERNESDYMYVQTNQTAKIPIKIPNWTPKPCLLSDRYKKIDEKVKGLKIRKDDTWVITYPKCGTTWVQEMVWMICNNMDYEGAKVMQARRFPFMEIGGIQNLPPGLDPLNNIIQMKSPRFIKSHLPVAFLPDQFWTVKPKMVYVTRNPKDVAVSYYHHSVTLHNYRGSLEDFVRAFIKDLVYYAPFHDHVNEYQNLDYPNMLILSYEDMKKDLKTAVLKTCNFFEKQYADAEIDKLCHHLSFECMKNNPAVNFDEWTDMLLKKTNRSNEIDNPNSRFIRKGEAGGWKKEMSHELSKQMDYWMLSRTVALDSK